MIGLLIEIIVDSFTNTIRAFGWPIYVVQFSPPIGAIALGLAFALFPRYVKPHITRWLFPDGKPVKDEKDEQAGRSAVGD